MISRLFICALYFSYGSFKYSSIGRKDNKSTRLHQIPRSTAYSIRRWDVFSCSVPLLLPLLQATVPRWSKVAHWPDYMTTCHMGKALSLRICPPHPAHLPISRILKTLPVSSVPSATVWGLDVGLQKSEAGSGTTSRQQQCAWIVHVMVGIRRSVGNPWLYHTNHSLLG